MKKANVKLEYNVLNFSHKYNEIKAMNIFPSGFVEMIYNAVKKKEINNYIELTLYVREYFFSQYRSRVEYEVSIGHIIVNPKGANKIDVYDQIMLNFPLIIKYINDEMQIFDTKSSIKKEKRYGK